MTHALALERGLALGREAPCLVQGPRCWSYADVDRLSARVARRLLAAGLGPGRQASVLSRNDAEAFICVFGISRAGMAWVPANPRLNEDDNAYLLEHMDCALLIFHSELADMARALRARLPGLRHWICLDRALDGFESLAQWLEGVDDAPVQALYDAEAIAIIAPTGGTTGRSKGVQLTQRNVGAFMAAHLASLHYPHTERPVNLAAAPLTHAAGFAALPTIARGGQVVVLQAPEPLAVLDAIEAHRVTELFLPPTVIYRLLATPGVRGRDYASLRYFIYAAAPMAVEKLKEALQVFGPCMTQVFGQAEAPMMCSFLAPGEHVQDGLPADDELLSSCGHPTPMVQVRILGEDNRPVPHGERGEICVRGDLVTPGYYRQPEATAATIVDGWLHTGDVGFIDARGRLHICDRKKDMIISGGFNIYPQEIEQVLWSHPGVEDCAVIGVPDDDWGEAVKAVVELKPGGQATPAELIALCKSRLGSLKSPKTVDFVAQLPRSPNGKVLKRDLRERYWQGGARAI
ncbi:Long-chain-fatty-acid--CoA ligase [Delftia tsuruhatensis]|uniref:AMP-binding protein n=1 Tax=Delftia tsuruhatensis TaxID=180282 RepID=UPI001E81568E|nr:AMP-binding protein [Delftia tsuruhatensis]CAB5718612.1 Long-chain-fatty-acid--CoA ligase [Delftia tsuruhatensis]CAC9676118.1 Long-chain-fatty-acid--CoA ligase [Delftia tsuruhatensis]